MQNDETRRARHTGSTREQRLAEALRENLLKRKALARAKALAGANECRPETASDVAAGNVASHARTRSEDVGS